MIHPVFSPSQTERYLRCPRLWDYSRRWELIEEAHWLAMGIGTAIHAGLAAHYRRDGEDPRQAALNTLKDEWPQEFGEDALPGAEEIVRKCLHRALAMGLGADAEILEVEGHLGGEDCRVDMAFKDASGITVVDWKYRHHMTTWFLSKATEQAQVSWQLRHYAWRIQEKYPTVPVTTVGLALVVGGPSLTTKWVPVSVTPMMLADWYDSALHVWDDIHSCREGYRKPRAHMGEACLQFGGCDFHDACHSDIHGDETRFHTLYKRREGK